MKRVFALIVVVSVLLGGCCIPAPVALVPASHTAYETPKPTVNPKEQKGSGTLGLYEVSIVGATLGKTYDGNTAAIVEFNWKNNSEDVASFQIAISAKVFQNGVECEPAVIESTGSIDGDAYWKEIKPGKEQKVWRAFVIQDDSPIEIEVSETFSFSDAKILDTLELK